MAWRIELDRRLLEQALDQAIGSLKRSTNKHGINPLMMDIIKKDIGELEVAKAKLTEVK